MTWTLILPGGVHLHPLKGNDDDPKALSCFAANRAILRPLAPSQTLALAPSAMSKRLRWRTLTLRCRETTSADFKWRLRLGREPHDSEADGTSSTLTHRTVPLQAAHGKHVETVSFYVTVFVTDCIGILLAGKA
ncbi:hypothetical protein BASA83_007662 [Batrachochytrium salamandrivorans]|nr:hypothetical protein BASA83_007662 [Batrachochytrium salamandrivorans]